MARMYPDRPAEGTPSSEQKVFESLSHLDDEWMVFHSVAWQGMRGKRQNDGEVDFVVAHAKRGVVIVEVKGGEINLSDGQWTTTNRSGRTHKINPFAQVRDSKHMLGSFLPEHIPGVGKKVHMGHAVFFPDVEISGDLSAEAKSEVILDRYDLRDIENAILRVCRHWSDSTKFDPTQFKALRQALAPTRKVRRLLRHEVEDRVEDLLELTDQQIQVLGFLRCQRRALVAGGAGTGKTVLAAERARQFAEQDMSVLFLCFNAPLGDRLAVEFADSDQVTVGHFHKFARRVVSEAGMLPKSGNDGPDFWSDVLPGLLPDAAQKVGLTFDAIVIDEGQDFHANWWTVLELLLTDSDDGFFYVFADDKQNLYRADWEPPFGGDPFELDINCRNTQPIAERVAAVFDRDERGLGRSGPAPTFVTTSLPGIPKRVGKILTRLLNDEGMRPDQITVLSSDRRLVDGLRHQKIEGHELVGGNEKGIVVETTHRFKGLESDAVVLVLPQLKSEKDRALAYVGMSRARVVLFVLGSTEVQQALNWP